MEKEITATNAEKPPFYLRVWFILLLAVAGFFGVLITIASLILWPAAVVLCVQRVRWSMACCRRRKDNVGQTSVSAVPVDGIAPPEEATPAEEAAPTEEETHAPSINIPSPEVDSNVDEKPIPVIRRQQEAFDRVLDTLPMANVGIDGKKEAFEAVDSQGLKYSNITARTNYNKLGNFVVVDTETTGIGAARNKIIEVSAIKFEAFEPIEVFTTLVNPGRKIPATAAAVNHITDEMVADAPKIWQIMPSLTDFIGELPIVGHNLPFDLDFLCRAGLKIGEKQRLFDTLQLARRTVKKEKQVWDKDLECYISDGDPLTEVENYKLQTLCRHFLICEHCDHRATGDALATGYLFHALAKERTGQ